MSEQELLARAVANRGIVETDGKRDHAAVRMLVTGSDLVFGLYPDRSTRGFNFTVIKGGRHLSSPDVRWDVIPFESSDAMDDACGEYGDYDWMTPDPNQKI